MTLRTLRIAAAALLVSGSAGIAQDMPFGTEVEIDYAGDLWSVMEENDLVGADAPVIFPYDGQVPHGMKLSTVYTEATVNGHTGTLVVKNNYGPEGVTAQQVITEPEKHLGAVTIMFKREDGYDPDNANWFWAKYLPDGSLDKNPKGMELAGRVAKGMNAGCIACHQGAGGGDYLFTVDGL